MTLIVLVVQYDSPSFVCVCMYVFLAYFFSTHYLFILTLDHFFPLESCLIYFLFESNLVDYCHAYNMAH